METFSSSRVMVLQDFLLSGEYNIENELAADEIVVKNENRVKFSQVKFDLWIKNIQTEKFLQRLFPVLAIDAEKAELTTFTVTKVVCVSGKNIRFPSLQIATSIGFPSSRPINKMLLTMSTSCQIVLTSFKLICSPLGPRLLGEGYAQSSFGKLHFDMGASLRP